MGQVKAGKSSLINALLGQQQAAVDILPLTNTIEQYSVHPDRVDAQLTLLDTVGYAHEGLKPDRVDDTMRAEISPKNILMIGPTGVGKTEIARRLAKLANAPFIKIEATKFTEVGYVGRDIESIVRDLVDMDVLQMTKDMEAEDIKRLSKMAARVR